MSNDLMKCITCGGWFNPAYLDQVFEHEHNDQLPPLQQTIKGVKIVLSDCCGAVVINGNYCPCCDRPCKIKT